jgi:hypothetical protein
MSGILSESDARRVIRALRKGATPDEYAPDLFVGQTPWFRTAIEMMDHTAIDEDFEVRFVRAPYGGGKTLFLRCLEAHAKKEGWVTAYILLQHEKVELDKPHTVVSEIAQKLELPDGNDQRGLPALLERALQNIAAKCGYLEGRAISFATKEQAQNLLIRSCQQKGLSYDFTLAIQFALQALFERDRHFIDQIARWLQGSAERLELDPSRLNLNPHFSNTRSRPVHLKPLGIGSAEVLLRFIAVLTNLAGYRGLYMAVDEIELITGLPEKRRANAFQTLRELVDQTDRRLQPPSTCLFLAATPEMFENREMFPKYKALQDRIAALPAVGPGSLINFKCSVVDLDRTELGRDDLDALGQKILSIYEISNQTASPEAKKQMDTLVQVVMTKKYVIARPRLFCRCLIDILDGTLNSDIAHGIAIRTEEMQAEREKEIKGK